MKVNRFKQFLAHTYSTRIAERCRVWCSPLNLVNNKELFIKTDISKILPSVLLRFPQNHQRGVGKTSLVLKFIDKNFNRVVTPTIGASLFKCCVNFNDTLINMQIWDTAGQERFRSMVPLYYRNVDAAFIVFDITRHYTFTVAKFWANELILKVDRPVVLTLIGNKKDLSKQRTVSLEEALSFAKEIGAFYYESSTQEFQGVQEIFFNTAKELLKYSECNTVGKRNNGRDSILFNQTLNKETNKSSCC